MRLSVYCIAFMLFLPLCQKAEGDKTGRKNPWGDISEIRPSHMSRGRYVNSGKTRVIALEEQPYRRVKGFWREYIIQCAKATLRKVGTGDGPFIRASSQLGEKYSPEKGNDGKVNTCWAEGKPGSGIGEWILFYQYELYLDFHLYNGLWASKELYYANNRIKKAEVTVYRVYGKKDGVFSEPCIVSRKVVELEDKIWPTNFLRKYKGINQEQWYKKYKKFKHQFFYNFIVIKILDVYRGTKYDDTCISEL